MQVGSLFISVSADASGVAAGLSKAESAMERFGSRMFFMGSRMTAGITLPLVGIVKMVTEFGSALDEAMTNSVAIMDEQGQRLKSQMTAQAVEMAKTSKFSAVEIAKGYYDLASAGLSAEESMRGIGTVTQFAQAGLIDMGKAGEYLAGAVAALGPMIDNSGDKVQQMAHVSDVLTMANNKALGTVEDFANALTNKAAAAMRMYGVRLEEGVAALMVYANQNIKGKNAGQQLWMVLRDLQMATMRGSDAWKRYGISVFDSAGNMRKLPDILQQIEGKIGSMSDLQRSAMFKDLRLQDRSRAALQALIGHSEEMRQYEKDLYNAYGTTAAVAARQMEAFAYQWEALKHSFQAGLQEIWVAFAPILTGTIMPALRKLADGLVDLGKWLSGTSDTFRKTVLAVLAFAAAIGPLIMLAGSFTIFLTAMAAPMVSVIRYFYGMSAAANAATASHIANTVAWKANVAAWKAAGTSANRTAAGLIAPGAAPKMQTIRLDKAAWIGMKDAASTMVRWAPTLIATAGLFKILSPAILESVASWDKLKARLVVIVPPLAMVMSLLEGLSKMVGAASPLEMAGTAISKSWGFVSDVLLVAAHGFSQLLDLFEQIGQTDLENRNTLIAGITSGYYVAQVKGWIKEIATTLDLVYVIIADKFKELSAYMGDLLGAMGVVIRLKVSEWGTALKDGWTAAWDTLTVMDEIILGKFEELSGHLGDLLGAMGVVIRLKVSEWGTALKDGWTAAWGALAKMPGEAANAISGYIAYELAAATSAIPEGISQMWDALSGITIGGARMIMEEMGGFWSAMGQGFMDNLANPVLGAVSQMWDAIRGIFNGGVNLLKGEMGGFFGFLISAFVDNLANPILEVMKKLWEGVSGLTVSGANLILQEMAGFWGTVGAGVVTYLVDPILSTVTKLWSDVCDLFRAGANLIAEEAGGFFGFIVNAFVTNMANPVLEVMKKLWEGVSGITVGGANLILEEMGKFWGTLGRGILGVFDRILTGITDLFGSMAKSTANGIGNMLPDWMSWSNVLDLVATALEKISNLMGSIVDKLPGMGTLKGWGTSIGNTWDGLKARAGEWWNGKPQGPQETIPNLFPASDQVRNMGKPDFRTQTDLWHGPQVTIRDYQMGPLAEGQTWKMLSDPSKLAMNPYLLKNSRDIAGWDKPQTGTGLMDDGTFPGSPDPKKDRAADRMLDAIKQQRDMLEGDGGRTWQATVGAWKQIVAEAQKFGPPLAFDVDMTERLYDAWKKSGVLWQDTPAQIQGAIAAVRQADLALQAAQDPMTAFMGSLTGTGPKKMGDIEKYMWRVSATIGSLGDSFKASDTFFQSNGKELDNLMSRYTEMPAPIQKLLRQYSDWIRKTEQLDNKTRALATTTAKELGDALDDTTAKLKDKQMELDFFYMNESDQTLKKLKTGWAAQSVNIGQAFRANMAKATKLMVNDPLSGIIAKAQAEKIRDEMEETFRIGQRLDLLRSASAIGVNKLILVSFEKMSNASLQQLIKIKGGLQSLLAYADNFKSAFTSLAAVFDKGGTGNLTFLAGMNDIGPAVDAGKNIAVAVEMMKSAFDWTKSGSGWKEFAAGAMAAFAAVAGGIEVMDKATSSASRLRNVINGAAQGASMGAAGGPWGALAGGIGGAIVGLLRRAIPDAKQRVTQEWGVALSDALAAAVVDAGNKFRGNRQIGALFSIDKIIDDAGGVSLNNFESFMLKLRDIFSMMGTDNFNPAQAMDAFSRGFAKLAEFVKTNGADMATTFSFLMQTMEQWVQNGRMSVSEMNKFLQANFSYFADSVVASGRIASKAFVDLLAMNQRLGVESKAVADFIAAQAKRAGDAWGLVLDSLTTNFTATTTKFDEAKKAWEDAYGTSLTDPSAENTKKAEDAQIDYNKALAQRAMLAAQYGAEVERMGSIVLATFNAAVANGVAWTTALDSVGVPLDKLIKAWEQLGITSNNAALNQLTMYRGMMNNNTALFSGVSALADGTLALSNMGGMTAEVFASLGQQGWEMYSRMQSAAEQAGGTTIDALRPMVPWLTAMRDAANEYGFELDAGTQELINQATQLGILKPAALTTADIMKLGFEGLRNVMEDVKTIIEKIGIALGALPRSTDLAVNVNTNYIPGTGRPPEPDDYTPPPGPGGPSTSADYWSSNAAASAPSFSADVPATGVARSDMTVTLVMPDGDVLLRQVVKAGKRRGMV